MRWPQDTGQDLAPSSILPARAGRFLHFPLPSGCCLLARLEGGAGNGQEAGAGLVCPLLRIPVQKLPLDLSLARVSY